MLLTACGGGGGGEAAAEASTQSVVAPLVFTEANAKAAATNAYISLTISKLLAGNLIFNETPTAAEVRSSGSQKAAVSYTVQCAGGGTIDVTGTVAASGGFTAGDTLITRSTNCKEDPTNPNDVIHGDLSLTFNSISSTGREIAYQFNGFQYRSTGYTVSMTGDAKITATVGTDGNTSNLLGGKSLALATTIGTIQRDFQWRDFSGTVVAGMTSARALNFQATVETRDAKLAAAPVSYAISTLETLRGGEFESGRVRLRGGGDLVMTFSADGGDISLGLDKDANGTSDTSITLQRMEMI